MKGKLIFKPHKYHNICKFPNDLEGLDDIERWIVNIENYISTHTHITSYKIIKRKSKDGKNIKAYLYLK